MAMLLDVGEGELVAGQRPAVAWDVGGAAVGEHPQQLVARHARPHPHAAGIHVDERRAGGRIEADAAALQAKPDLAQFCERHAGDIKIHGVAEHVLGKAGDAAASAPQHGVGRRRAIAADHVDRMVAGLALHFPDQVDELRIHANGFAAPPVAQKPVELLQRGLVVAAVALVSDADVLAGVDVVHRDGARVALGDGVLQRLRAEQQQA
jgi:hypothetical protein